MLRITLLFILFICGSVIHSVKSNKIWRNGVVLPVTPRHSDHRSTSSGVEDNIIHISVTPSEYEAPKYREAYYNFSQFKEVDLVLERTNGTQTNIEILFAVIDGLINSLAERNGAYYNAIFEAEAAGLFKAATDHPDKVIKRLRCVVEDVQISIESIHDIITSNAHLIEICNKNPEQCNAAIQAIIKTVNDNGNLSRQGDLLILLGEYTGLYESDYRTLLGAQNQLEQWELLIFLVSSKDSLRPLIEKGAKVRKMMGGDKCTPLPFNKARFSNDVRL